MGDIGVTLTVLAGLMGVGLGEALGWGWLLWLDLYSRSWARAAEWLAGAAAQPAPVGG
jgi:hypothetical protein